MTSREIAELTGKEHKNVLRDVRVLKEQLGDLFGGSAQTWAHPQNGQTYEEFALDKDTCLTLLLGYDAVARMKVVKRWQELESAPRAAVSAVAPGVALVDTLATAIDRGVMSRRAAVARLDAFLGYQRPPAAPQRAPAPAPAAKRARKPSVLRLVLASEPFTGFDGLQFVLGEAAQYVAGGEPALRSAMLARGLITDVGGPTAKGRALVSHKSPRGITGAWASCSARWARCRRDPGPGHSVLNLPHFF